MTLAVTLVLTLAFSLPYNSSGSSPWTSLWPSTLTQALPQRALPKVDMACAIKKCLVKDAASPGLTLALS